MGGSRAERTTDLRTTERAQQRYHANKGARQTTRLSEPQNRTDDRVERRAQCVCQLRVCERRGALTRCANKLSSACELCEGTSCAERTERTSEQALRTKTCADGRCKSVELCALPASGSRVRRQTDPAMRTGLKDLHNVGPTASLSVMPQGSPLDHGHANHHTSSLSFERSVVNPHDRCADSQSALSAHPLCVGRPLRHDPVRTRQTRHTVSLPRSQFAAQSEKQSYPHHIPH